MVRAASFTGCQSESFEPLGIVDGGPVDGERHAQCDDRFRVAQPRHDSGSGRSDVGEVPGVDGGETRASQAEQNATERVGPARSWSPSHTVASPPRAMVATRKTAALEGGVTTGWDTAMRLPTDNKPQKQ
jgi:hypothetical protein